MDTTVHGELWKLALGTLKPKANETAQQCLNRLVRERITDKALEVTNTTAEIRMELWATERLRELKRKHDRTNDKDDRRPLVVVEYQNDKLLIDGNHRVSRWLSENLREEHEVIVITIR